MTHRTRAPSEAERALIRRVLAGRSAVYDADRPVIRAAIIRKLLLADRTAVRTGGSRDGRRPDAGTITIEGADIAGKLDVGDATRADGLPLPGLVLRRCTVADGIDLQNTHIRRIDLGDTALPSFVAAGARIDGDVRLEGIRPLDPESGECRVDLTGARIGGGVELARAHLRVVRRANVPKRDRRYALEMRNAMVDGRVLLEPGFVAEGGVSMNSATVRADIWGCGCRFEARERYAFSAQNLRCDGAVVLRADLDDDGVPVPMVAKGWLHFYGARIGGIMDLSGAWLECAEDPDGGPTAAVENGLNLVTAEIRGVLLLAAGNFDGKTFRHRCDGMVSLVYASIGSVVCNGAVIAGGIDASHSRIGGDFTTQLDATTSLSALQLDNAHIDGSVLLSGAFYGTVHAAETGYPARVISGRGARIAGELRVANATVDSADFEHASIAHDVTFRQTRVDSGLHLAGMHVGGSIELSRVVLSEQTSAEQIDARADLALEYVSVRRGRWTEPALLDFHDLKIAGEIRVRSLECEGRPRIGAPGSEGVLAIRRRDLACYPGWVLLEATLDESLIRELGGPDMYVVQPSGVVGLLARLRDGAGARTEMILLTGSSQVFHEFNRSGALRLETVEQARDYLLLFTSYVWTGRGQFRIIDPVTDVRLAAARRRKQLNVLEAPDAGEAHAIAETPHVTDTPEITETLEGTEPLAVTEAKEVVAAAQPVEASEAGEAPAGEPPTARADRTDETLGAAALDETQLPRLKIEPPGAGDDGFRARASLIHDSIVYDATFVVRRGGTVEMLDDRPVAELTDEKAAIVDRTQRPVRFARPLAERCRDGFPPNLLDEGWTLVVEPELRALAIAMRSVLRAPATVVNLGDSRADRLDDEDGDAWIGNISLRLDGLTYARAPRTTESDDLQERSRIRRGLRSMRRAQRLDMLVASGWLQRRPVAGIHGWYLAEIFTFVNVAADGARLGTDRGRIGALSFLWHPRSGITDQRSAEDRKPNVIVLAGNEAERTAVSSLRAATAGAGAPSVEAAKDTVRLHLWCGGVDGRPLRIVEVDDPALPTRAESQEATCRPFDVSVVESDDGCEFVVSCTVTDGTVLRDLDGVLPAAGGAGEWHPGPERPLRTAWSEKRIGPLRVLDVDTLQPPVAVGASVWGRDWNRTESGDMIAMKLDLLPALIPHAENLETGAEEVGQPESIGRAAAAAGTARRVASTLLGPLQHRFGASDRERARLRWLGLQYPHGQLDRDSFRPHPYEVAAAAFRNEGASYSARRILSEKLRLETRLEPNPLKKLFAIFNGWFFDHGLSAGRAILWTLALLVAGWTATAYANRTGLLVIDFTPSATVLVPPDASGAAAAGPFEIGSPVDESGRSHSDVRCGDHISNIVFAADLMVPILDFGQQRRCQVATARPPGRTRPWHEPAMWRVLFSIYSGLGAIFISMTILTIAGVLRRRAES